MYEAGLFQLDYVHIYKKNVMLPCFFFICTLVSWHMLVIMISDENIKFHILLILC